MFILFVGRKCSFNEELYLRLITYLLKPIQTLVYMHTKTNETDCKAHLLVINIIRLSFKVMIGHKLKCLSRLLRY